MRGDGGAEFLFAYDVGFVLADSGGGLDFDASELVLDQLHAEVARGGVRGGKVVGKVVEDEVDRLEDAQPLQLTGSLGRACQHLVKGARSQHRPHARRHHVRPRSLVPLHPHTPHAPRILASHPQLAGNNTQTPNRHTNGRFS
jgi:hypothetical protein